MNGFSSKFWHKPERVKKKSKCIRIEATEPSVNTQTHDIREIQTFHRCEFDKRRQQSDGASI